MGKLQRWNVLGEREQAAISKHYCINIFGKLSKGALDKRDLSDLKNIL